MMHWKEEPMAIKKALTARGFTVISAKKGKGTARVWNHIKVIDKNNNFAVTYTEANKIAEETCGHDKVAISVVL